MLALSVERADASGSGGPIEMFHERPGTGEELGPIPLAAGNGNHSLATSKQNWEAVKVRGGEFHTRSAGGGDVTGSPGLPISAPSHQLPPPPARFTHTAVPPAGNLRSCHVGLFIPAALRPPHHCGRPTRLPRDARIRPSWSAHAPAPPASDLGPGGAPTDPASEPRYRGSGPRRWTLSFTAHPAPWLARLRQEILRH